MAVSKLDVTAAQLRAAAKKIRNAAADYSAAGTAVKNDATNLGTMWKGDSADAFNNQRQKNYQWMTKMYRLLLEYSAYLDLMADKYEQYDSNTSKTIKSSH